MAKTDFNAQDLLEKILASGQDLIAEGKQRSKGLTSKGKDITAKGEDYLVDKLGIEDNKVSRDALRKGVGAGAAAGALALLLTSRSGRKLATIGGLAGLGTLAWRAYKEQNQDGHVFTPKNTQEISGAITGPKAEARAETIIRAMIAAAKADGRVSDEELTLIGAFNDGSVDALKIAINQPASPKQIAALATSAQEAREIYAASCRVAEGLNQKERDYLDRLAMALELGPELAARLETDVRTG